MKKSKICIVGLHKTGTTSLSVMLERFGYLVTGPDTDLYYDYMNNNFENIDAYLQQYDVFQDDPWYAIFDYLDQKETDMKFIYLVRDEQSWLNSVQRFYGADRYNNKVRRHFYGNPNSLEYPELYINKFRVHKQRVLEYFKDKPNFIKVDVRKPEDAIALQKFLGLRVRYKKFPLANKYPTTFKEKQLKRIKLFVASYFGLNSLAKFLIKKTVGYTNYIEIRSKIRYQRSLFKKFKVRIFNNFFKK